MSRNAIGGDYGDFNKKYLFSASEAFTDHGKYTLADVSCENLFPSLSTCGDITIESPTSHKAFL